MAQMVLPQTPSPGIQQESGPSRSGSSRDTAERKSDFESVSQAEQKRLDRQKAERNDNADSPDESQAARSDSGKSEPAGDKDPARKIDEGSAGASEGADAKAAETQVAADEAEEGAIALPLTFAELQSWLDPKAGGAEKAGLFAAAAKSGSGSPAGAPGQPGPGKGLFNGLLMDSPGQNGKTVAGSVQDATLTEAMKAASLSSLSETGRNPDSGTVLASGRF
ncbi:MAG: flagellar hook-length control protein FliK, partial [Marinobacter sp.]|nr:flagellar hook-length control protein FliK [Marinobacter sp.]